MILPVSRQPDRVEPKDEPQINSKGRANACPPGTPVGARDDVSRVEGLIASTGLNLNSLTIYFFEKEGKK